MRLTRSLVVLSLAAAACAGCSKHATEPAPPGSTAPRLVATYPAARAVGIFYTTSIWGEFDRALDARTVNEQSVFLKLDGQRVTCDISYDAVARRVIVDPVPDLQLQRTYTVEFSTTVESAEGVPVEPNIFFQFSTNSLRELTYDFPAEGDLIGPLSRLGWGGSQIPVNEVFYEVYAGTDSVAVALRQVPYLQRTVFTRLLPSVAWPSGQRVYWAISSHNTTTDERLHGPVSSFVVVPAGLPVHTVKVIARDYGSMNGTSRTVYCSSPQLPTGPLYNGAIHWDIDALDANGDRLIPDSALVVAATVELVAQSPNYTNRWDQQRPSLWLSQTGWLACSIVSPGPPYPEVNGLLSESIPVDGERVRFAGPRLAAFLEADLRNDIYLHGTLIRTLVNTFYESPGVSDPTKRPELTLQYVLAPPTPQNAARTAARRQALEKPAQRRSIRLDPAKGATL